MPSHECIYHPNKTAMAKKDIKTWNESELEEAKKEFLALLRSTERDGVEDVIEELERLGFFKAPASVERRLNFEGGLLLHSLNTCKAALAIWESMIPLASNLADEVRRDGVIIAALLHDVCKSDIYTPIIKKRKTSLGYYTEQEGYKVSYENLPIGHGEKSVVLLLCSGLEMREEEMLAIRWHMAEWEVNMHSASELKIYNTARELYPLVTIIQTADRLAASLIEEKWKV